MAEHSTIGRPPRATPAIVRRIQRLARIRARLPDWSAVAKEVGLSKRQVLRIAAGYQHKKLNEQP